MSTTYEQPSQDVIDLIAQTMRAHHQRLEAIGLKLSVLIARGEDEHEPALKLHGYPALAITKILNLKLRAYGLGDAEIVIDGGRWELLSRRQRTALIDHELTHLEPVEKKGMLVRDEIGRPKLQMRLHDIEIGVFTEVAARHGAESIERQQYARLVEAMEPLEMEFAA